MQGNNTNIYKNARQTAGLTQERWADQLGVSSESIRLYESGRGLPSDDVVARMAEVGCMPVLAYWHLKEKSGMANDILPDVKSVDLAQAVIQLLCEIRDFKSSADNLMTIAADGYISAAERDDFSAIVESLDGIVRAALQVKYAQRVEPEAGR